MHPLSPAMDPRQPERFQQRLQERLTADDIARFDRDGALCIKQLLTPEEVALLREGIDANLAAPSPRAKVASRPDDPGRFFEDFCNWQDIPQFGRFVHETPLALAAQRLMQSRTVRLYHDHVLVKEPGTRQRTPWHQDQPYYNIDGTQNISMWIPVDPVLARGHARICGGFTQGPLAHAAHLHGQPGQVVPRRQPARFAGCRGRPRRLPHRGLGDRARRRGVFSHAHAACGGRGGGARTAAACSRCAFWATTRAMRPGRGRPRPSFRAWQTRCPLARRWTTRCSRCWSRAQSRPPQHPH